MIREEKLNELRANGVIIDDPTCVTISESVVIKRGAVIENAVTILGDSIIESGAHIGSGSRIENGHIGANTDVMNSVISDAYIGDNGTVGPYAHVHKGSKIGDNARIGNFVEIKNSNIGSGTKMAHLAYIGDADIGEKCNIGCGVIFVNYDGKVKRRSSVGNGVFIGSNSNVIAPVHLEDGAYLAAGSTLTVDLEKNDLCIARCRETIKPNRSKYQPK